MRYILVEYEYGFERTHEYLYSQVYTHSIPWFGWTSDCENTAELFDLYDTLMRLSSGTCESIQEEHRLVWCALHY